MQTSQCRHLAGRVSDLFMTCDADQTPTSLTVDFLDQKPSCLGTRRSQLSRRQFSRSRMSPPKLHSYLAPTYSTFGISLGEAHRFGSMPPPLPTPPARRCALHPPLPLPPPSLPLAPRLSPPSPSPSPPRAAPPCFKSGLSCLRSDP